jgi:hypothetical protein
VVIDVLRATSTVTQDGVAAVVPDGIRSDAVAQEESRLAIPSTP